MSDDGAALVQHARAEGHRILDYWRAHVIDPAGGFHGEIQGDGGVRADAPRSLVLATRILWTYSHAINSGFADTLEHRAIADSAYTFLVAHYWDPVHLGFYWMIAENNQPVQDFKHVYGQSFAIYALAEYYALSGRAEALTLAQLTYSVVERFASDGEHGGYLEAFLRDWRIDPDVDRAPVNHGGPKSMNTHLHVLEAFTRLYQVWPSPDLRRRLTHVLDIMMERVVNAANSHFDLFFTKDWSPIGDLVSYGHDIEGSWLMVEAAEALGDEERLERSRALAIRMVDAVLSEGVTADLGVMNEGRGRQIIDSDIHWWPQAEAVVGCVNAYQISCDRRYLDTAEGMWTFIERNLLDEAGGEWRLKVSKDGAADPRLPRVSPWKCPYHNTRACMEVVQRLGR